MNKKLTKEQLLKRCEVAIDMGLLREDVLRHTLNCCDAIMRCRAGKDGCEHQMVYFDRFMEAENKRTDRVLANDRLAYNGIELLSLLAHPCQKCAEDKNAWHTRWGFCKHKKNE